MKHDILGEIDCTDCKPFDGVAKILYGSRHLRVGINRDDQTIETALNLAAEVARRLPELDKIAKRVAVAVLRKKYTVDGTNTTRFRKMVLSRQSLIPNCPKRNSKQSCRCVM